jgi:hypothetical protein
VDRTEPDDVARFDEDENPEDHIGDPIEYDLGSEEDWEVAPTPAGNWNPTAIDPH